jgi:hypothetical protein
MCAARDCAVENICPQILHIYSSPSYKRELKTDISIILGNTQGFGTENNR